MAELKADVLVLGAGMVGVGAALHLQKRGRDAVLIDRHELAGEETSYGNGGLIESASVFPYMFPRDLRQILQYASNRTPQVRYHFSDLPAFLPWLVRYFLASSPERALHSAKAELPLIQRSLIEHEALIAEANVPELLRRERLDQAVPFRCDACQSRAGPRTRQAIWRRRRRARRCGDRGARAEPDRRFRRRRAFSRSRLRPRSRRPRQGLCGAVRPQGRPLPRRRRADARTIRRAMARGDAGRHHHGARGGGGDGAVVRPDLRPARLFDPAQRQARLSSASQATRQCRAQSSRCWTPIRAFCWRR